MIAFIDEVLALLNVILSDLYKNKKNKIIYICALCVIMFDLWYAFRYVLFTKPPEDFQSWLQSGVLMSSIVMSVASGFVITFFVQREYEDKTIINVLFAPTNRITFVFSKLTVWFLWFLTVSIIGFVVLILGAKLAYNEAFGNEERMMVLSKLSISYLYSFVASIPLLMVTFIQRNIFYPSLMCALVMTAFQMLSVIIPLENSRFIPWAASLLYGLGAGDQFLLEALVPVAISGIVGIVGACSVFRKQDV